MGDRELAQRAATALGTTDHDAVDALPEGAVAGVCWLLWGALDARGDLAVVICDHGARMVGGSSRIEAAGRPLVPGLAAGEWPERYELRRRPGGPMMCPEEIPIVRALTASHPLDVRMYQGLADDDGELVGRAVPLRDYAGRGHGAVGVFHRDPLVGPDSPPGGRSRRPADRRTLHLLVEVLRALPSGAAPRDPLVGAVDELLQRRHRDPLRLADVAAHIGLTSAHLTTRVRELTGLTVMQRLEAVRLGRAERLLAETSLTVSEIAARTGPWDPSTFSRAFRRRHGCSPSQWRERAGA